MICPTVVGSLDDDNDDDSFTGERLQFRVLSALLPGRAK